MKLDTTASQRKYWPRLLAEHRSEAQEPLQIQQNRVHIRRWVLCRPPDCCGANKAHQEYNTWQSRPIDSFSPLNPTKSVQAVRSIYCQLLAPHKHLPEALFTMLRRRCCESRDRKPQRLQDCLQTVAGLSMAGAAHSDCGDSACGSRIGRPSSPDQQAQQVEAATTSGVTACETKAWHEAARNCCGSERIGYAGQDFSSRPAD